MIDEGKKNVLGVLIDAVDYEAAVSRIIDKSMKRQKMSVSALAVHGVMTGAMDRIHRYRLNHFDLIVPDGQPVCWALNMLYHTNLPGRVYGPTLMLNICEKAEKEKIPIYLYGSQKKVVETLQQKLIEKYPGLVIAGAQPSKFRTISPSEKTKIVKSIKNTDAGITFVGLGCPRQEVFAYEFAEDLSMPVIAVGAAFDFHAGLIPQAPTYLQKSGLEWLFRLSLEPKRLWKRYLMLNPLYMSLLFFQLIKLNAFDPDNTSMPQKEIGYA